MRIILIKPRRISASGPKDDERSWVDFEQRVAMRGSRPQSLVTLGVLKNPRGPPGVDWSQLASCSYYRNKGVIRTIITPPNISPEGFPGPHYALVVVSQTDFCFRLRRPLNMATRPRPPPNNHTAAGIGVVVCDLPADPSQTANVEVGLIHRLRQTSKCRGRQSRRDH